MPKELSSLQRRLAALDHVKRKHLEYINSFVGELTDEELQLLQPPPQPPTGVKPNGSAGQ